MNGGPEERCLPCPHGRCRLDQACLACGRAGPSPAEARFLALLGRAGAAAGRAQTAAETVRTELVDLVWGAPGEEPPGDPLAETDQSYAMGEVELALGSLRNAARTVEALRLRAENRRLRAQLPGLRAQPGPAGVQPGGKLSAADLDRELQALLKGQPPGDGGTAGNPDGTGG